MEEARRVIKDALERGDQGSPVEIQPAILFSRNIDLTKATSLTSAYVNDSWKDNIEQLIASGWTIYRIQTEFGIDGHYTMAYFAKMPTN